MPAAHVARDPKVPARPAIAHQVIVRRATGRRVVIGRRVTVVLRAMVVCRVASVPPMRRAIVQHVRKVIVRRAPTVAREVTARRAVIVLLPVARKVVNVVTVVGACKVRGPSPRARARVALQATAAALAANRVAMRRVIASPQLRRARLRWVLHLALHLARCPSRRPHPR
jgi:hypothetical protein